MSSRESGSLLVIGGNEEKEGECPILRAFVELAGGEDARIVILTTATELPKEVGEEYRAIFEKLGAGEVRVLFADTREEASSEEVSRAICHSSGIFLTGGDQLRLTSILGGSEADRSILRAFHGGTIVAGTSAGASAMASTMIVSGDSADTATRSTVSMAQG
ncbi:MAG: cyanophycinase, partial [Selenomonadales bacterium]|nr:cyanophycinase [Selenomonadales bacterium]